MEEANGRAALIAELRQAMELLRQLEYNPHCLDLCKTLTPRIASSIHNSIVMAESVGTSAAHDLPPCSSLALRPSAETSRRRNSMRSWRRQVRLSSVAGGVEGPAVDDGFTWRKYGQKEILGAKYPRAYFRCTHRTSHGCPAKKQVQRSDDDPSVYEVTYHEDHTCLEQPREEKEQLGGAMQRDEVQQRVLEVGEVFADQIAPSFGPPLAEGQFFSASPCQFGGFHGADQSSLLPMEFEAEWEMDAVNIWAGVEWTHPGWGR